jgi:alpha/beta superfamily hydrolase
MHNIVEFGLQGVVGNIECNLHVPNLPTEQKQLQGIVLVLHPHPLFGGTMDNKIVQTIIRSVNDLGYVAVRFNFRGVGNSAGVHDHGNGETTDALQVLSYMQTNMIQDLQQKGYLIDSECPVVLGGFSFGTFVASNMLEHLSFKPKKMLMIGTAAGKWDVKPVPIDSLIVHGDNDDVIPLENVVAWAKKHNLIYTIVPDAGHFFHGKLLVLKQLVKQSLVYTWE